MPCSLEIVFLQEKKNAIKHCIFEVKYFLLGIIIIIMSYELSVYVVIYI